MPMTEAEWLACDDPHKMLVFLRGGKAGTRKLRLFAVGCCRRYWLYLRDEVGRNAVEVAERHADGFASDEELFRADMDAEDIVLTHEPEDELKCASASAADFELFEDDIVERRDSRQNWCAASAASASAHQVAAFRAITANGDTHSIEYHAAYQAERADQAKLLRCLFGAEFHKPSGSVVCWRTAVATSVADAIYADRAFDRLPILADALEDAGCDNRDILDHCRQPGEHARGCWVVDLVLGKA